MPVFLIRDGLPADAPVIAAFNAAMARETEALELDPVRLLAGVRAVFDDPSKGEYWVAEERGGVCGIRLYVERHNEAAKRTYAKLGMSATIYEMWEEDFVVERAAQQGRHS